jgi:hypothetical protein
VQTQSLLRPILCKNYGIYPAELLLALSEKADYSDCVDITISSRDGNGR